MLAAEHSSFSERKTIIPMRLDGAFVSGLSGLSGDTLGRFIADVKAHFGDALGLSDFILSDDPDEMRWRIMAASMGYANHWHLHDSLPGRALEFASLAHGLCGQRRKYTGSPYFMHPLDVALLVSAFDNTPEVVAAALLHDVVEDAGVPLTVIQQRFGPVVASLVDELTDVSRPEDGNRKRRKEIDRQHTAAASPRAKSIKLADLISNTSSIVQHDSAFARVYLEEKALLLDVLGAGHPCLMRMARESLRDAYLFLAGRGGD